MRSIFFLLFFFPFVTYSQWKYKSSYNNGFHIEVLGLSRGISANYNHVLYNGSKGFVSSSLGLSFVAGQQPKIFNQSGIGIPLMVTYNHSLGDLDKRIKKRLISKCSSRPPKYNFEWFAEGGGGLSPIFYKSMKNEIVFSGYLGGRLQMVVDRPYKNSDLVVFLRAGYLPFYRVTDKLNVDKKSNVGRPIFGPDQTGNLSVSLGLGF